MTPPPAFPDWEVRLAGWAYIILSALAIATFCWAVSLYGWWLYEELRRRFRRR